MYKIITKLRCELGEGLLWDHINRRLLLTDITKQKLISVETDSETYEFWEMPSQIGWVLLSNQPNNYYVGLENGIGLFNKKSMDGITVINGNFPNKMGCRLNDACVDALGRIWYGSMNYISETANDGMLASFSNEAGLRIHDEGFMITNGPLISPDSKYLLLNDSARRIIYKYDFSLIDGNVSNRRQFIKFDSNGGFPDGMCFDSNENLWLAMWGAGKVLKINRSGDILKEFNIDTPYITNVCFGGVNLDRIFVSSAAMKISKKNSKVNSNSGSLFELKNHKSIGLETYKVQENICLI